MGQPRDIFKAHPPDCECRMSKLGLKIEKFGDVAQLEQANKFVDQIAALKTREPSLEKDINIYILF